MQTIRGFGDTSSKIMVVIDALTEVDVKFGRPFSSFSAKDFGQLMLEAGLSQSQCFNTVAVREVAPDGDPTAFVAQKKSEISPAHRFWRGKYCLPVIEESAVALIQEIETIKPNVIIALGTVALWMLTGEWGIIKFRSSCLENSLGTHKCKVIPTYSPGLLGRMYHHRNLVSHDLRKAKKHAVSPTYDYTNYQFLVGILFPEALDTLQRLRLLADSGPLKLSVDIETRQSHIACIGIAWSITQAICIPLMCAEKPEGYWTLEEEVVLQCVMRDLLTHPNVSVVGQNFSYDAQYFWRYLHYIPNLRWDTMIAQHSMFSNLPKSLDMLSSLYCRHHVYWKDDGKEWNEKTGEVQLWRYNCEDACRTYEVDEGQRVAVKAMGLEAVNDFQQKLFWPVLHSMNRGVRYDTRLNANIALKLMEEISNREAWLTEVLGTQLNIKSPLQMKELFYDVLGQKPVISRKTGTVTCDDEALGKIVTREPMLAQIISAIQDLRSLSVFLSTFIRAPLDTDSRMRSSFSIAGTETYRFSSSTNAFNTGANLQNIPKGGATSSGLVLPNVRDLFLPDHNQTMFDIDLSSADLRIVVWEADEKEMKAMLKEGYDPYTEIAKEYHNDPTISKKDPRRQTFKYLVHGTHYLGTASGLAQHLGLLVHDVERVQKWYFERFPRIRARQIEFIAEVTKRRWIQNIFGYRYHFFGRIEGTVLNEAAAWIPQSTVACLINRGYVNIRENLPWCEILLQVHDSLVGQFPTIRGEASVQEIIAQAEIALPYDDPLVIPVGAKTSTISWGDCE